MKKLVLGAFVALTAGMLSVPGAFAAAEGQPKMTMEEWKKLTPEQQAEKKAAAKAEYDAMTPEQQAEKRAAVRARYDALTPEQQAAAKKHFAEKHPRAAERGARKKDAEAAVK